MPTPLPSRRRFLQAAALTGAAATLPTLARAQSTPPPQGSPVQPGTFRTRVGDFEVIALNDGIGTMARAPMWAPEAAPGEAEAALRKWYLDPDTLRVGFTALLVRTQDATILLDTGSGPAAQPRLGHLSAQLAAAAIPPASITHVFISHAHGDHINGLFNGDTLAFPNAEVCLLREEADFWTSTSPDLSTSRLPPDSLRNMAGAARTSLEKIGSRLRRLRDGEPIVEGVTTRLAPGHTPGHGLVRIASNGQELLYLADLAHHPILMFENVGWTVAFDTNPALAASTRRSLFAEFATNRHRVQFFHLPFPGIGHIRSTGTDRYEWIPEPWTV